MFWLSNKKIIFWVRVLNLSPGCYCLSLPLQESTVASWYEQVSLFILLLHYSSFIAPLVIAQIFILLLLYTSIIAPLVIASIYLVIITLQSPDSSPCYSTDYVPPNRRVGRYIDFGADPVSVHFFVSVHYLLNLLMDFDQTCIYTLLGEGGRVD